MGLSSRINIVASLPITRWSQAAENEDSHHRTETLTGLQDLNIGARYIISNSYFGQGTRFFVGMNLTLPTGTSYEMNPFTDAADSTDHRHFAFGTGSMQITFTSEWWYRSEFPWVVGLTTRFSPRWLESEVGYQPGSKFGIDLHAIGQSYRFWRGFPYFTLNIRQDGVDHWAEESAPNSGGLFFDGTAGLDIELTEQISGVLRLHAPIWSAAKGSQQTSSGVEISFRFVKL